MMRMRFLRARVRLRRFVKRPGVAGILARGRQGTPYLGSAALNLLIILVLAVGYTSFVAKGVVGGGLGERVVTVELYDRLPTDDPVADVPPEDPETPEEGEIGQDAIPEGNAVTEGEEAGDEVGDEPPQEELGQDVAAAKAGVSVPQVALPDVDPGEGRPDGIVGVDCYAVFADDEDKALECAGREILSGWRAEVAKLGEEWAEFARDLGTENRRIRYGPLRGSPDRLEGFNAATVNAAAVPQELQERYAAEVERLRQRELERRFGPEATRTEKESREAVERSEDASTYDPLQPEISLGDGN